MWLVAAAAAAAASGALALRDEELASLRGVRCLVRERELPVLSAAMFCGF